MKKILVAEDHLQVRENIAELLGLAGYQCIAAADGREAVEKAISNAPDLILCDVMMPQLDGYGVIKILRSNPKTASIPLIFLTARSAQEDLRKGMGLGAADYITKPFDNAELLQAIELRLLMAERETEITTPEMLEVSSSKKWKEMLQSIGETRHFHRKDVLMEMENQPRYVMLVLSGLLKRVIYSRDGRELIVSFYAASDFCAFEHLLADTKEEYSMIAVEDSAVVFVETERFVRLMEEQESLKSELIAITHSGVLNLRDRLCRTAFDPVRSRVAAALLELLNIRPDMALYRDDLAGYIGISKETLIRYLSDLREEGLILISEHHIRILNVKGLIHVRDHF